MSQIFLAHDMGADPHYTEMSLKENIYVSNGFRLHNLFLLKQSSRMPAYIQTTCMDPMAF